MFFPTKSFEPSIDFDRSFPTPPAPRPRITACSTHNLALPVPGFDDEIQFSAKVSSAGRDEAGIEEFELQELDDFYVGSITIDADALYVRNTAPVKRPGEDFITLRDFVSRRVLEDCDETIRAER